MPLRRSEADELVARASALGVELGIEALDRFGTFVSELERWSERVNLISAGDRAVLVERHLVDSLAAVPILKSLRENPVVADLGSGAGLPGVPLAIAIDRARLLLIEPRRKRANFLRAVARALAPLDIEVLEMRGDAAGAGHELPGLDAVVTRAATSIGQFLTDSAGLLRPGGLAIAYSTSASAPELSGSPAEGFVTLERRPYRLTGQKVERCLLVWRRR